MECSSTGFTLGSTAGLRYVLDLMLIRRYSAIDVPAVMRWTLASPTKLLGVHADTSRTPRAGQDGSQDGSQPQRGSADASKTRAILEERDATFLEHG